MAIADSAVAHGFLNGMALAAGCRGLAIMLLHHLPNLKELQIISCSEIETVALTCLDLFDTGTPAGLLSLTSLVMLYDFEVDGDVRSYML